VIDGWRFEWEMAVIEGSFRSVSMGLDREVAFEDMLKDDRWMDNRLKSWECH
jgi:hypothetical protein